MLWSKAFWLGAAERAVKTFAGALVSSLVGYTVLGAVPWWPALGTAALATLVSFLIAVGNADFTAGVTGGTTGEADPVVDDAGTGTAADPYVVSAPTGSAGTVTYPSSVTVSAPGTLPTE